MPGRSDARTRLLQEELIAVEIDRGAVGQPSRYGTERTIEVELTKPLVPGTSVGLDDAPPTGHMPVLDGRIGRPVDGLQEVQGAPDHVRARPLRTPALGELGATRFEVALEHLVHGHPELVDPSERQDLTKRDHAVGPEGLDLVVGDLTRWLHP